MANVRAENISDVNGNVNIAGRDIINHIQTIYERALTAGEVLEKELQLEVNELARGVRDYLERLKQQVASGTSPVPYKGLEAYTLPESQIFFGRNKTIHDLREAMQRSSLTVLQAESGAGKTSLLQAGIIPHVISEGHLAILIRPQFENPTQTLKKCLLESLERTPLLAGTPLVNFLRRVSGIIGHQTTLYLVLDQFEEFFAKRTLEEDRQAFIRDLAECLNDATLNVRWVISITSDALGQIGKFESYIRNPFSNVQSLYLFTHPEAADVIGKTARYHGLSFQDGLLDRILNDLGHQRNDPIAPTQIQLVCAALYDDLREGQEALFTHAQYDQKGGTEQILHRYIENVLQHDLPPEERPAAYKILEALVTSEKKRVIRARNELEVSLQARGIPLETLDSALNHLVNRRLLRQLGDQRAHLQYEIVHDYLLKEIEINEDVRNAKEAEELLEQGLRNWERQKLLLAPDALKIIESRAVDAQISSPAAQLLFLTAIEYERPAERWVKRISQDGRKSLIEPLLMGKSSRKKWQALWSLRDSLTSEQRARVTFTRSSITLLTFIRKGVLILFIGIAVWVLGAIGLTFAFYFVPWTEVTSFSTQCLNGGEPSDLLVAIDGRDASRVVAYDARNRVLCETQNTGATWEIVDVALPADLIIHSIALSSVIYLATDQGFYYQGPDGTWQNLEPVPGASFDLRELAVSADNNEVYMTNNEGRLYRHDILTGGWDEVSMQGVRGAVTDIAANHDYLAISTQDGIWYREINADDPWKKFDLKLEDNVTITAIQMVYPIRSWAQSFFGPIDHDWFLATTETGRIYSGYITETGGLQEVSSQLPGNTSAAPISSLAVNEASKFSTRSGRLYCEQSWTILDSEWWLSSRFSKNHPCE